MDGRKRGIVSRVGQTQYGYFIQIEGDERYFNTKYEPKCTEGAEIGIEYSNGNEKRAQIRKIKVFAEGSPRPAGNSSSGGAGSDNRQDSIVWQHSQEMAIRAAGLIKLPAKEDAIMAKLDELTVKFFKDAMDPRSSEAFGAEEEVEEDLAEAQDTTDGFDDWD